MKHLMLTAIALVGLAGLSAAPAGARNYDCSKAGNKNKTECKGGAAPAAAKPVAAKPAKAAKAATVAKTTTTAAAAKPAATTARNYDCSKPGNKNKAACKGAAPAMAAAKPAPAPSPMTSAPKPAVVSKPVVATKTASTTRNYDCSKAGNANKAVCKSAVAAPAPRPRPAAKSASAANDDHNPAGAIARCKDGFYSHSKQRVGSCSRHGGVAQWS